MPIKPEFDDRQRAQQWDAMIASLVINGRAEHSTASRPAEVLRRFPPGPYTVTVIQRLYIEAWERHLERLTQSIKALCSFSPDGRHCGGTSYAGLAARLDASRGKQSLFTYICNIVKHSIKVAELDIRLQPGSQAGAPTLITILLHPAPRHSRSCPLAVLVHALQVERPALDAAIAIQLVGPQRQLSIIKHSRWAADRQPLEAALDEGVVEGVLSTPDGCLLEGLTSNIFVVVGNQSGSKHVQTAAVSEGVLGGITRLHVMEACKNLGIFCVESAPKFQERDTWKEVFVTNCMKRVQAVHFITCSFPPSCSGMQWSVELLDAPGPLTRLIQEDIVRVVEASCVQLDDL